MSHKGMFVFILRQQKLAMLIVISNNGSICKGFLNSQSSLKKKNQYGIILFLIRPRSGWNRYNCFHFIGRESEVHDKCQ